MGKNKQQPSTQFLKNPPKRFLLAVYTTAVFSLALALIILISGTKREFLVVLGYVSMAVAVVSWGYSLFTFIVFTPRIKRVVSSLLKQSGFFRKMLRQYGFRTVILTIFAVIVNVVYIIYNGIIAIRFSSIWYGVYTTFYALLAWLKVLIIIHGEGHRKGVSTIFPENRSEYEEPVACLVAGSMLMIVPTILAVAFSSARFAASPYIARDPVVYMVAAYTFYRLTLAVINMFRARKDDNLNIISLRTLGLVDAIITLPALQAAILNSLVDDVIGVNANRVTGIVVCVLAAFAGIYIFVISLKETLNVRKKRRESPPPSEE